MAVSNILKKYQQHFKHIPSLYAHQEKALSKLFQNKNTLSIVPTGGGKSLIFQLAALEFEGLTIVISPLVALMEEQVNELNDNDIPAVALTGSMSFQKQRRFLKNLNKKPLKLLYLSPERLHNSLFKVALIHSNIQISMVVVDEAHCISQWGVQFRPEYGLIMRFVNFLKDHGQNPILFALTATLGLKERRDIINEFKIAKDAILVNENIIRTELVLHFEEVEKEKEKLNKVYDFLKEHSPTKTLVYLYSRLKCEQFAGQVRCETSYKTEHFHAGMTEVDKKQVFKKFKEGEIDILFATTAFGMGINIPDIDAVIHMQIPSSIEEYYQQVGRGARKCATCVCLLLWSQTNINTRIKRIKKEKITLEQIDEAYGLLGFDIEPEDIGNIKSIDFFDYRQGSPKINLHLIRFHLEKHGIVESLGEINGSPLTIRLKAPDEKWEKFISNLDDFDFFDYASELSGIPISEIIDHLYNLEMQNKIEYLPAFSRQIFFKINHAAIPRDIVTMIADEINQSIDFRLGLFGQFAQMCKSQTPIELIRQNLVGNIA